jgi:hypothetical protein
MVVPFPAKRQSWDPTVRVQEAIWILHEARRQHLCHVVDVWQHGQWMGRPSVDVDALVDFLAPGRSCCWIAQRTDDLGLRSFLVIQTENKEWTLEVSVGPQNINEPNLWRVVLVEAIMASTASQNYSETLHSVACK